MESAAPARSYAKTFDKVAAEYDRHRPAYPDELIDRVCEIAGLSGGEPVLEVGCGSGQLTRSLLTRGLRVTAVEPGAQLRTLAERNLAGAGEVEFVNARFEEARLTDGRFRAVFSAAAFHWIDPDVGWRRAARALAPGGTLVLIQHCGLDHPDSVRDQEELLATWTRIAPDLAAYMPPLRDLQTIESGVAERCDNVSEVWAWLGRYDVARADTAGLFCDLQLVTVPVLIEQTADEMNALLRTTSLHERVEPEVWQALEHEHVELHRRLGRRIQSHTVAVAVTAQRT
jgi:ubiquinone/menaquinone biosynthesis C-methylase UbiE